MRTIIGIGIGVGTGGWGGAAAPQGWKILHKSATIGQKIGLKAGKVFVNNGSFIGPAPNILSLYTLIIIGDFNDDKNLKTLTHRQDRIFS